MASCALTIFLHYAFTNNSQLKITSANVGAEHLHNSQSHPGVMSASSWSLPVWGLGKDHSTGWRLQTAAGWLPHSDRAQAEKQNIREWGELLGRAELSQHAGVHVTQVLTLVLLSYTNIPENTNTSSERGRTSAAVHPALLSLYSNNEYAAHSWNLWTGDQMNIRLMPYTHNPSEGTGMGNTMTARAPVGVYRVTGKDDRVRSSSLHIYLSSCECAAKTGGGRKGGALPFSCSSGARQHQPDVCSQSGCFTETRRQKTAIDSRLFHRGQMCMSAARTHRWHYEYIRMGGKWKLNRSEVTCIQMLNGELSGLRQQTVKGDRPHTVMSGADLARVPEALTEMRIASPAIHHPRPRQGLPLQQTTKG